MRRNSVYACCLGMAWANRSIVRCKELRQLFFIQKGLLYMGFAQYGSPFYLKSLHLPVRRKPTRRATVSVENQRGSCRFPLCPSREKATQPSPQAWLSCKTKMQILKSCAERSGAHLKSFCFWQNAVIPALPAAPARSRCSDTCRWSSAQRSGRTPLQCWRCSAGSCTAQYSPDAWGAWAAPCGQPCHPQ